MLSYSGAL